MCADPDLSPRREGVARVNTRHLRQRLWLWLLVRVGTRDCSPRQLFRFWLLLGIGWLGGSVFGLWTVFDGVPASGLFLAIMLFMVTVSIVLGGMALADLRSPRTVEGRVTGCQHLRIRGTDGTDPARRYGDRITIEDRDGVERIFRASDEGRYHISEGDTVRARVGMRLRWIYDIEVLETTQEQPASQ